MAGSQAHMGHARTGTSIVRSWSKTLYKATPRVLRPTVKAIYCRLVVPSAAYLAPSNSAQVAYVGRVIRAGLRSVGVLPPRRRRTQTRASVSGEEPVHGGTHAERSPVEAMDRMLQLFERHELMNLVAYVPEDLVVKTRMVKGSRWAAVGRVSKGQQRGAAARAAAGCGSATYHACSSCLLNSVQPPVLQQQP